MKIIVIALSGIGDALMFTPALKTLKAGLPNAQIEALVMFKGVIDFYSRIEEIDKIHYFDFLKESKISALKFVAKLRNQFDVSINVYPSNRKEYNLISFLINAKQRIAIDYLRAGKFNLSFLNTHLITENDILHNVEENISMVELLTGKTAETISSLEFPLLESDFEFAENYFKENKIPTNKINVGFHAGCQTLKNHINRRWAPEKFIELANKIIEKYEADILLFGGPDEYELNEKIHSGIGNNSFIVSTKNLIQTASIMKKSNVFVTNDSALMHISAALKLKTIALIGPTNTNYITPWQTENKIASIRLECSPCFFYSPKPLSCSRKDVKYKCIKELETEHVFRLFKEFIY